MFEQLFKNQYCINKHRNAPLLEERIKYIQSTRDHGASLAYLKQVAQYLLRVIEFLDLETSSIVTIEEVENAALKWENYQSAHRKQASFSKSSKKKFTRHAIHWLRKINRLECLPEERIPLFKNIYDRRHILQRHVMAPLLKERLMYLQFYKDSGSVENSIQRAAEYLLTTMEYLDFYELRKISVEEIKKAAICWETKKAINPSNISNSKSAKRRFIFFASSWLEMIGCLIKPSKKDIFFEKHVQQYINYMRDEKGLAENTIKSRGFILRDFLSKIEEKTHSLIKITPLIIDEILITKYNSGSYSRSTIQIYASAIRAFLRYAGDRNMCHNNLADSIKAPRVHADESLPSSPSWEDVKKILTNAEGDNPTNIRDRAILMLLSVYGMRSSEVANLRLKDLDWKNEILYLSRSKNAKQQKFPLSKSVGEAILRYIKEVRQNNSLLKEVFVCMKAPYRPLTNKTIYGIVARKLKPLALEIKHHGPHALRHACATHLINNGISLKEISEHLGHQGLESTRIYTKVDLESLRKVTEFEIGDLL